MIAQPTPQEQAQMAREIAQQAREAAQQAREAARAQREAARQAGQPGSVVHTGDGTTITTSPDGRRTTIAEPNGKTTEIVQLDNGRVEITSNGQTTTLPEGLPWTAAIQQLMSRPEQITEVHVPPDHMAEREFARDVLRDAFPLIVIIMSLLAVTIIGLPIARAFARRMDRKSGVTRGGPEPTSPELTSRLDRIEQAIETMAIEVERVSEAQRYSARLLTERLPESPERAIATEHARR